MLIMVGRRRHSAANAAGVRPPLNANVDHERVCPCAPRFLGRRYGPFTRFGTAEPGSRSSDGHGRRTGGRGGQTNYTKNDTKRRSFGCIDVRFGARFGD